MRPALLLLLLILAGCQAAELAFAPGPVAVRTAAAKGPASGRRYPGW